jgi:hypothetical protein
MPEFTCKSRPLIACSSALPTVEQAIKAKNAIFVLIPTCNQTALRLIAGWYGGEQSQPASF